MHKCLGSGLYNYFQFIVYSCCIPIYNSSLIFEISCLCVFICSFICCVLFVPLSFLTLLISFIILLVHFSVSLSLPLLISSSVPLQYSKQTLSMFELISYSFITQMKRAQKQFKYVYSLLVHSDVSNFHLYLKYFRYYRYFLIFLNCVFS